MCVCVCVFSSQGTTVVAEVQGRVGHNAAVSQVVTVYDCIFSS